MRLAGGDRWAWWALLLGLLATLPLVVLTPPLQVPDEAQHLARAVQLAGGGVMSTVRNGRGGAVLPASLDAMARRFLGTDAIHAPRPVPVAPLAATLRYRAVPLAPGATRFTDFSGAAFYAPPAYLPQVAGVAVARAAGAGPLGLLYAARLANALAAVALLVAAVALAPFGRPLLLAVGLLPMAAYQYASASPDALTIATALLFAAIAARAAAGAWTVPLAAAALTAGATFCALKPVYAPLLLAGLLPAGLRRGGAGRAWAAQAAVAGGALGLAAAWLHANAAPLAYRPPGADPGAQIAALLAHPLALPGTLAATLAADGRAYAMEAAGAFGWLTVALPPAGYALAAIALAVAVIVREPGEAGLPPVAAFWHLLLSITAAALVMIALLVMWTPPGSAVVEGVQGRYFLPILGVAGLALRSLAPAASARPAIRVGIVLPALIAAQIAVADATIVRAFGVF